MPASAADIAVHKLVSLCPANASKGIPSIFGQVTVCKSETGKPEMIPDGPTLTGGRTAAVSMLGIENLKTGAPRCVLVIGTGTQATYHIGAISEIFPGVEVLVQGGSPERAVEFSRQLASAGLQATPVVGAIPDRVDTVITLTTCKIPVYREAARNDRLLIGVGSFRPDAAEFTAEVVMASDIFVDDFHGAREESGDLLQAGVDWSAVRTLSSVIGKGVTGDRPIFFKSVGSGAWDLAAGRVARESTRGA
jgi:1-piperideine-2-carboxylate/1-pyrroline-2-carboxylate reductase [NAD(P)H]